MKMITTGLTGIMVLLMFSISMPPGGVMAELPPCINPGEIWVSSTDGAEMVCVSGGPFLMGASVKDTLADDDEKPQHVVELSPFWIDRMEVTNAQYAACMAAGACQPEIYETSALTYIPYSVHPDYQHHPALIYIYDDAEDYCRWAGRRLPTEAEWEKAARSSDGRMYPWGNVLDCEHANYYMCNHVPEFDPRNPRCGYSSFCRTARVDDYPRGASPYGVLNMSGNVWEWVSDYYDPDYYRVSAGFDPTGPESGEFHTRRGGGASSLSADVRVTARASGKGEHYYDGQMGFRCAVDSGE